MRVALFATCVNDAVHPSTAIATVRLLERLGVEVDFPAAQTCCGQPQFNTGYRRDTEPLVRRMGRAFEGYDYVVTPSG
ncbi:heterodisulfide reductase-related iron-sulfur binding cluster, partial [Streptomyces sp. NPDC056121]